MADSITKSIVLPVDGSKNSLKAVDYLSLLFGNTPDMHVTLFYVQPSVPPILAEESIKDRELAAELKAMQKKNERMGQEILEEAKSTLLQKGFDGEKLTTISLRKELDVARDICTFAENKTLDAIVLASQGRSRLEAFFVGETANKVLEASHICPVWLVKGAVTEKPVLISVDHSENALKAVDHAGFMLAKTDAPLLLYHSQPKLRRFLPQALLDSSPKLESLWRKAETIDMEPVMAKAREVLRATGIEEGRIRTKVEESSRNPAADVVAAAKKESCGTIVLGREGATASGTYSLAAMTRKVAETAGDIAVWVV